MSWFINLLPSCQHHLGQRLPAPRQLGRHPGRQIRIRSHLADELADHVGRGDVAGRRAAIAAPEDLAAAAAAVRAAIAPLWPQVVPEAARDVLTTPMLGFAAALDLVLASRD